MYQYISIWRDTTQSNRTQQGSTLIGILCFLNSYNFFIFFQLHLLYHQPLLTNWWRSSFRNLLYRYNQPPVWPWLLNQERYLQLPRPVLHQPGLLYQPTLLLLLLLLQNVSHMMFCCWCLMVFNATFNNISVISWLSI